MGAIIELEAAALRLRAGGLVAMPTETVYGLAARADDAAAVAAVFATKERPAFDPLIVHVADAAAAWRVAQPNDRARALAAACWPGPLTLVLPRQPGAVADLVTSGLDTVGVRCPDHDLCRALLRAAGLPLAAPSANRFGRISPTTAAHVEEQFGDAVPVLDGGPCRVGVESTVVSLVGPEPVVLRPGGVPVERLAAILGAPPRVAASAEHAAGLPQAAPGLLASHYAPRTPLVLRSAAAPWPSEGDWGFCAFSGADLPADDRPRVVLSPAGDVTAAAAALFAALRRLDASPAARLMAELVPPAGLGLAINDRLRRAAGVG